jgi:hypothetical protein
MKRSVPAIVYLLCSLLPAVPALGSAQAEEPATGFALWVRAPGRSLLDLASSAAGSPQFGVGFRRERLTLGLGFGLSIVRTTDRNQIDPQTSNEEKVKATAFQVGPQGSLDIWRSTDGRVRGQIKAGIAAGRFSLTDTTAFRDPFGSSGSRTQTRGTLVGVHVALGGEHFLHPHFALGIEAGLQGTFTLGVKRTGTGRTLGVGASGAYGALRAMLVF